jgi:hypothetical protein
MHDEIVTPAEALKIDADGPRLDRFLADIARAPAAKKRRLLVDAWHLRLVRLHVHPLLQVVLSFVNRYFGAARAKDVFVAYLTLIPGRAEAAFDRLIRMAYAFTPAELGAFLALARHHDWHPPLLEAFDPIHDSAALIAEAQSDWQGSLRER